MAAIESTPPFYETGPQPKADLTIERGRTGTLNFGGFLQSEEYNVDLKPPRSFTVYDRMAMSDPTCHATLQHILTPILAAARVIKPASPDPQHLEQAAFVDSCMHDWMARPFASVLEDNLKFLRYGHALLEGTYMNDRKAWLYIDERGASVNVPERDVMIWKNWAPRLPRTIYRWLVDDDELYAVEQYVYINGTRQTNGQGHFQRITIPIEKCLLLVNEQIGDDYWGQSILRGAYKPWWLLENIQRVAAIGVERYHVGTPMVRMKPNSSQTQKDAATDFLMGLRSGESTAGVYSGDMGIDCDEESKMSSGNNHAIWILKPDGTPPDALPIMKHLESNIFTNILARFMDLGQRETGARATAEVQRDPFFLALMAIAKKIEDAWNRGPIQQLIDLNYPNVDSYPKLTFHGITPQDEPIIANAAALWAQNAFLTPDGPTEQWIRDQLGMPQKVIDELAVLKYESSPATTLRRLPPPAPNANGGVAKPSNSSGQTRTPGGLGTHEGGDTTNPTTGLTDPFWHGVEGL